MSDETKTKPEINFQDLVMMHTAMCAIHLGQAPNPATGKIEHNLPAVQETIALLEMFKEKTKGNLDEQEDKALNDSIYALQMSYVQAVQTGAPTEAPEREDDSTIVQPKPKIYTPYDK